MVDRTTAPVPAYGVYSVHDRAPRVGVRHPAGVVDLADLLDDPWFATPSLNPLLAAGPERWSAVHAAVAERLRFDPVVAPHSAVTMHLPIHVGDFVDFFSSLEHATNTARILRPGRPVMAANWRRQPAGYHARASTVVVSDVAVVRPWGQFSDGEELVFAPTRKLDVEVELGFVVGVGTERGRPVGIDRFEQHVFGAVILLDWSARDIQAFEQQPLGPFLGKSFATTISPWIVPLAALDAARVPAPARDPEPPGYLREAASWSLDVRFELEVDGVVLTRPRAASHYWSAAQQFAHLGSNGAALRTGDLYGIGTVSSFEPEGHGSLLEYSRDGTAAGRGYLRDGERVVVRAAAWGRGGVVDLGEASAIIDPAPAQTKLQARITIDSESHGP